MGEDEKENGGHGVWMMSLEVGVAGMASFGWSRGSDKGRKKQKGESIDEENMGEKQQRDCVGKNKK